MQSKQDIDILTALLLMEYEKSIGDAVRKSGVAREELFYNKNSHGLSMLGISW